MRRLGHFLYDFVVGDDPLVALLVIVAIAAASLLHRSDLSAWWLLPTFVAAALALSIRKAARHLS